MEVKGDESNGLLPANNTNSITKVSDVSCRYSANEETTEKHDGGKINRKCSCCHWLSWYRWVKTCQTLNRFFEELFLKMAFKIALNPCIVLVFSTLLPVVMLCGYSRYYMVMRSEDLYLPQSSRAMKELPRAEEHFTMSLKLEEFIIKKSNNQGSILEDRIFEIACEMHHHIVTLPSFQSVCFKNALNESCLWSTPLEIFRYNCSMLRNIPQTLSLAHINLTLILKNGRQAFTSYPSYFGYFQFDNHQRKIKRAEALRNVYYVQDPNNGDIYEKLTEFESHYISYMDSMREKLDKIGLTLLYNCGRSIDISLSDSVKKDITLVPIALFLMVLFCTFTLARFKNKIIGHVLLGISGIFALFLGIGSSFGFLMLTGTPYIAFVGVLPFLVLGVGIDNIFIIIDSLDRQDESISGAQRIANSVGEVGASITMTTLTDLVAFFVSMVTDFPAIRYFCMYAAISITFCYLLVVTMFIAFLTYDVQRIERRRKDIMPCSAVTKHATDNVWEGGRETVSNKIMTVYAETLMKKPIRYAVLILSVLLVGCGAWGAVNIDQNFNQLVLGLKDSAYVKYFTYFNRAYPTGTSVSIILDSPVDYTDPNIQRQYVQLDNIAKKNKYMKDFTFNWMSSFLSWSKKRTLTKQNFYPILRLFLKSNPQFFADLRFNKNRDGLLASRAVMFSKDNPHSVFRRDSMVSIRKDLEKKSTLPVFAMSYVYIYIEQFVIVLPDTIRNLVICACAILLITLPYLIDPKVTFFVFFGFVSLMFELLGMMYLWSVSLNTISMIIMIMGIGFAVDYSAHIAHAFVVSREKGPTKRVVFALRTMGASVTMGGLSTFIGVIVTAFASSELFKIFFKMVFGIVVLGLLHGLVFLPVHLSIFCRNELLLDVTVNTQNNKDGEQTVIIKGEENNDCIHTGNGQVV